MVDGGWRDAEGRTALERRRLNGAQGRARFIDRVRHRPLSLVKPALLLAFATLLAAALILRL
ncbi:MAG: hypothetical protein ACREH4_16145 [Vitreimonas sp.]